MGAGLVQVGDGSGKGTIGAKGETLGLGWRLME